MNFKQNKRNLLVVIVLATGLTTLNSCLQNSSTTEKGKAETPQHATIPPMAMLINHPAEEEDPTIIGTVDIAAAYPGGYPAFNQYMDKKIKFYGARQGRTIAQFVVEKDGSLSDIKIVRSVGKDFDAQVIPALKACKKWQPAILKGQPVRTRYVVPVNGTFMG